MIKAWTLPFSMDHINGRDPGHEGPSCLACAQYQADRRRHAEQCPMLRGDRGRLYRSPHVSSYLFEERFSRWACTQGQHGPLDPYGYMTRPDGAGAP